MNDVRVVTRATRDLLGEGPIWSLRENAVFWVDILGRQVHRLALDTDAISSLAMPDVVGWVIERRSGGMIAGIGRGAVLLDLDPLAITPFAALEPDMPGNRINDAKADASGRLWAGTMPFGCDKPTGSLYRIDPDACVTRMDTGYHVANGPAIDPKGQYLYHTDSALGYIYRFPLADNGTLGPRDIFLKFEPGWGSPDGMSFDAEGGLWVAHWGGGRVSRFRPDGTLDRDITLPTSQITSVCFAGPHHDRMFVTSAKEGREEEEYAGALFEVDPGVRGIAPHQFAN